MPKLVCGCGQWVRHPHSNRDWLLDCATQPGFGCRARSTCHDLQTSGDNFAWAAAKPPKGDKLLGQHIFAFTMKFRVLGAGLVAAGCFLAPQQAQALSVTTTYVPFKIYQNPIYNTPTSLSFQNFNSIAPGSGSGLTLTGVSYKIAGASNGTGSATADGNPVVTNTNRTGNSQAFISYAPQFNLLANGGNAQSLTGGSQNASPNPVNCNSYEECPGPANLGGNLIPSRATRDMDLNGIYRGSPTSFASLVGAARTAFSSGVITSPTASANFSGTGTGMSYTFDPSPDPGFVEKPYLQGFIALEYQYDNPPTPGARVPGPLPLVGAAAAFGWSRRLKNRISSVA